MAIAVRYFCRLTNKIVRIKKMVYGKWLMLDVFCLQGLMKQNSLDDHESLNMDVEAWVMHDANEELAEMSENDERRLEAGDPTQQYNYENPPSTSAPAPLPMLRGQYFYLQKYE